MPDPKQVLIECRRVLKTGGKVILHEVLEGDDSSGMLFPVPWAEAESGSHLVRAAELAELMAEAGFELDALTDWSEEALEWRRRQRTKEQKSCNLSSVLSPAMILGDQFPLMAANVMRNLVEGTIRVVELVVIKG